MVYSYAKSSKWRAKLLPHFNAVIINIFMGCVTVFILCILDVCNSCSDYDDGANCRMMSPKKMGYLTLKMLDSLMDRG